MALGIRCPTCTVKMRVQVTRPKPDAIARSYVCNCGFRMWTQEDVVAYRDPKTGTVFGDITVTRSGHDARSSIEKFVDGKWVHHKYRSMNLPTSVKEKMKQGHTVTYKGIQFRKVRD